MDTFNIKRMRLFMALNALIIITFIYVYFAEKDIIPRKLVNSGRSPAMRHRFEENCYISSKINNRSSRENHDSTIGNYQHNERISKAENNNYSLPHSNIEAFLSFSAYSNQLSQIVDIKTTVQGQLSSKSIRQSVPIVSTINGSRSIKTSSGPPPFHEVAPELTKKLYESGHLNEEIDMKRICMHSGVLVKLLILITSAQSHLMARMSIRQTWMHYGSRRDVGMAFVLGRTTNATLNESLNQENYIYSDMIRGNFIDSYFNLTLKTISMLEWVDIHCRRVKFILKTDDDMFINVPKLLDFIHARYKNDRTIYGRLVKGWKPERNKNSKYFVSHKQYGGPVYPPFTTGPAYLLTGDIVHELYVQALRRYYMPLEDVFITGIVTKRLNIKRVLVNEFRNTRFPLVPCKIRNVISVHMIKPGEQYRLWKDFLDSTIRCKRI